MGYVLVVEDEASLLRILLEYLRQAGLEAYGATNVAEAIARLEWSPADVVVSDVGLPDRDGLDFLQQVRDTWPEVPMVMVTGEPDASMAAKALRLGAADYLFKPITRAPFLHSVQRVIRIRELEAERRLFEEASRKYQKQLETLVAERTAELQQSEARFRRLYDEAPVGYLQISPDGIVEQANQAWLRLLNLNPETACGRPLTDFALPEWREAISRALESLGHAAHARLEVEFSRVDGGDVSAELMAVPAAMPDGRVGALCMVLDRTMARTARQEQQMLFTALEMSDEAFLLVARDSRVLYVNEACERLIGQRRSEVIGMSSAIFRSDRHEPIEYVRMMRTLVAGRPWRGVMHVPVPDGRTVACSVTVSPVQDEMGRSSCYVARLSPAPHASNDVQTDQALNAPSGLLPFWLELLLAGARTHIGNLRAVGGRLIAQDPLHGEQVLSELLNYEQFIQAMTPLLESDMSVAMHQPAALLQAVGSHMQWMLGDTRTVRVQASNDAPVRMHAPLVGATLSALVLHDFKTTQQGDIALTARVSSMDRPEAPSDGEWLVLTVQSQAAPVSENDSVTAPASISRLLDAVATAHNGFWRLDATPSGRRFWRLCLPVSDTSASSVNPVARNSAEEGEWAGKRALLVDDNAPVRMITSRMLRSLGFQVSACESPRDALALAENADSPYDLVVSDVVMPEMDGVELLKRLRSLWPDVAVLMVSGYTRDTHSEQGDWAFVGKPFTLDALQRGVRDAFGSTK